MERSKFRQSLKWAIKEFVLESILESNRDNKKLFKLASSLMGTKKENQLPECDSKEKLANQFAEFFIAKSKLSEISSMTYQYMITRTVHHLSCQVWNL